MKRQVGQVGVTCFYQSKLTAYVALPQPMTKRLQLANSISSPHLVWLYDVSLQLQQRENKEDVFDQATLSQTGPRSDRILGPFRITVPAGSHGNFGYNRHCKSHGAWNSLEVSEVQHRGRISGLKELEQTEGPFAEAPFGPDSRDRRPPYQEC